MKATTKQVNYALHLLGERGYSTRYMDASFKALGASMRQRSGKVADWLGSMDRAEISALIRTLEEE